MSPLPWPKALESWEPELRHFARELVGQLAPLSERIAHAVGPLRISTERRSDEPNGYSALSRRGPYERLLISEWALQLEHEDEFIRRASSGEHLFVELERRSPAISLEAWLLLDTGPSQLGSPRIAHLAALVAFARRARAAGIELHWAPLWNWEQPAHTALNPATLQAWLAARNAYEPTAGLLDQWERQWPEAEDVERDVWLIGGDGSAQLARDRGWSSLVVDDETGDGTTSLELRITPAKKRRTTTLRLTLPEVPTQVRLLRDPFDWNRPRPQPALKRGKGPVIALNPSTELAFSHDGHRLLARTDSGSVVAIPVRNSARASYGWPTVAELPPGMNLVAAVWGSRRARGLVVLSRREGGVIYGSDWDGRVGEQLSPLAPLPLEHELFVSSWPMGPGWQMRGTWFEAGKQQVDPAVLFARAFGSFVGRVIEGLALRARVDTRVRTLEVLARPEKAWLSWEGRFAAACQYSDRVEALHDTTAGLEVRALPLALFAQHELQGVLPGPRTGGVTLLALRTDRRSLHSLDVATVAPQWKEEIRARAPIETFAISPNGRYVAWRDLEGEVAIYSRDRAEMVLRLHASNVSVERP